MRKLWCLEVEKIGEKILDGISNFSSWKTNGGNWRDLKGRREGHFCPTKIGQTSQAHVWGACATRDQRAGWVVWHTASTRGGKAMAFGHLASPAHLSCSSAVFGHPNSDFESFFGLQIVTPSRTTKTMKLWQMVENSSRKMTTNTTQRMRTKSSVATSFGLKT